MNSIIRKSLLLGLIVISSHVVFAADKASDYRKDFMAVYMEGAKVGWGCHERKVEDGKVYTTDAMNLTFKRLGNNMDIKTNEQFVETVEGEPISFKTETTFNNMPQFTEGVVKGGFIDLKIKDSTGGVRKDRVAWPEGAVMAEKMNQISIANGTKEGTSFEVKLFLPSMLSAVDVKVDFMGRETVDILGQDQELIKSVMTMTMPMAGEVATTTYVDENLEIHKSIMPVMGINLEIVECSEEFAMSEDSPVDFFKKLILTSPVKIENPQEAKYVKYHIKLTSDKDVKFVENDNQKIISDGKGGYWITVEPIKIDKGERFPYTGNDAIAKAALESSHYVQSDDKDIKKTARKIVKGEKDSWRAAKKIEKFVDKYITSKNYGVGYASAAEVLEMKEGDCSEHAVLTAALCRAVGIPARVSFGIVYAEAFAGAGNVFGGHAWTEVYINGKWIGLDATISGKGFGAGHIQISNGNGEPGDFFGAIGTFGYFKIDEIEQKY